LPAYSLCFSIATYHIFFLFFTNFFPKERNRWNRAGV
jgi:hypothetical protein